MFDESAPKPKIQLAPETSDDTREESDLTNASPELGGALFRVRIPLDARPETTDARPEARVT